MTTPGEAKVPPFLGVTPFQKSTPKTISASKMQIDALQNTNWRGKISAHFYTKTAGWRSPIPFWRVSIYILEGVIYIVEAEIVLGVLYRKGVIPKKGGTLASRESHTPFFTKGWSCESVRLVQGSKTPQGLWSQKKPLPPTPDKGQEDVNGEKLTVKKWWIFGADFFTVWCRFFHGLRRFFAVYKGHKR